MPPFEAKGETGKGQYNDGRDCVERVVRKQGRKEGLRGRKGGLRRRKERLRTRKEGLNTRKEGLNTRKGCRRGSKDY